MMVFVSSPHAREGFYPEMPVDAATAGAGIAMPNETCTVSISTPAQSWIRNNDY